jgi:hypothetical protein
MLFHTNYHFYILTKFWLFIHMTLWVLNFYRVSFIHSQSGANSFILHCVLSERWWVWNVSFYVVFV